MKNSLSWERAIRASDAWLTLEERAAGWPEAFSTVNLARLQYPLEGGEAEKYRARNNQRAIMAAMDKALESGSLPYVERTRTEVDFREVPATFRPQSDFHGLGSPEWLARDTPPRMVKVESGERAVTFRAVEANAFRAWLSECGEEPSEHIRAWFALFAVVASAEQNEPLHLTPMKRAAIISNLCRKYPSLESDFNRPADWVRGCSTGKRGEYYLEKVKAACSEKWGDGDMPVGPVATIRMNKMRG